LSVNSIVGQLDLFRQQFGQLQIPPAVLDELKIVPVPSPFKPLLPLAGFKSSPLAINLLFNYCGKPWMVVKPKRFRWLWNCKPNGYSWMSGTGERWPNLWGLRSRAFWVFCSERKKAVIYHPYNL
jgi:hypothetical protein